MGLSGTGWLLRDVLKGGQGTRPLQGHLGVGCAPPLGWGWNLGGEQFLERALDVSVQQPTLLATGKWVPLGNTPQHPLNTAFLRLFLSLFFFLIFTDFFFHEIWLTKVGLRDTVLPFSHVHFYLHY